MYLLNRETDLVTYLYIMATGETLIDISLCEEISRIDQHGITADIYFLKLSCQTPLYL